MPPMRRSTRTPKAEKVKASKTADNHRPRPRPILPPDVTAELREIDANVRAMITPAELADMFDIGERTVQRRCHAREWPHHRLPGRGPAGAVRFTADDVRAIVDLLKSDRIVVPVPAKVAPRRKVS